MWDHNNISSRVHIPVIVESYLRIQVERLLEWLLKLCVPPCQVMKERGRLPENRGLRAPFSVCQIGMDQSLKFSRRVLYSN